MSFEEFKEVFLKELSILNTNIDINDEVIKMFFDYMNGIISWNDKINVTAIIEPKEFIVKHFVDSITINEIINNEGKLLDVGTGAGFPGIPIKLLNNKLSVTLIDSVNKKLNVIRDVTKDMNIDNLEIIHSRAEDLARDNNYREKYDYVTTRAVSNLSTILEYMVPFLKVNGIAICMKGPNFKEEIDDSTNTFKVLGICLKEVKKYVFEGQERNVLIIEKIKKTDEKYPRGGGKPLKEPLK